MDTTRRFDCCRRRESSSKISKVEEELRLLRQCHEDSGVLEKAVVVSQWTSMLDIVKRHVEKIGLRCVEINWRIPVKLHSEVVVSSFSWRTVRRTVAHNVALPGRQRGGTRPGGGGGGGKHLLNMLDMH